MESNDAPILEEVLFTNENIEAEKLIEINDLSGAARILVDIVEKDMKNARAFNNIGIISWKQEEWDAAYNSFMQAVKLNPIYNDAVMNLYDAALKLKRAHLILPFLKNGVSLNPEDEELKILADSIELQGDDVYLSERALNIGFFHPKINEANTLIENGELNKAMEILMEVNDQEGPSAEVFTSLGVISFYQKRYKDAFSLFFESIKLNPLTSDTFLNLMDAALECDLVDDAWKLFDACSAEFSSLLEIKEELESIAKKS